MAMIGTWDDSNCLMALAPLAWSKGNGTSNQNTGEFPAYPAGTYNATLTNMVAGYGYIYGGAGLGKFNFDGSNDFITTTMNMTFTNTNKFTWEMRFKCPALGASIFLFQRYDSDLNYAELFIRSTGQLDLRFRKAGGSAKVAYSTNTLTAGSTYFVHAAKNGATLSIYINGSEVTYAGRDSYDIGDLTPVSTLAFSDDTVAQFPGEVYWLAVYDDAISSARILTNSGTAITDLAGSNTGDAMALSVASGYPLIQSAGQFRGQLTGNIK